MSLSNPFLRIDLGRTREKTRRTSSAQPQEKKTRVACIHESEEKNKS